MPTCCGNSAWRARREAEKERLESTLELLYTALTEGITGGFVSYRFDSGEGSQMTKRVALADFQKLIEKQEARLDQVYRALCGSSVAAFRLRRLGGR